MSAKDYPRADEGSGLSSKERYEKVLDFVRLNTGGPNQQLPAFMSGDALWRKLSNSELTQGEGDKAIKAALQNDDLLRYDGGYAVVEEESLQAIIETEAQSEDPNKALIGKCNTLLSDLRGGA